MRNKYLGKLKNEIKIIRALLRSRSASNGMTYVELIIVLSIFSVMTSVILFNYNKFEENVDIKVLANDIALKIVEAQKSAVSGKWDNRAPDGWKPSYTVSFIKIYPKEFFFGPGISNCDDCDDIVKITKGNFISKLEVKGEGCSGEVNTLNIDFIRPNSEAKIYSTPFASCVKNFAQITVSSPSDTKACIQVYSSGRSQIGQCK